MPTYEPDTQDKDTLVLISKEVAAEGVVVLELSRADGGRLPDWTPGAHIDVILEGGAVRQYSLCGDPADTGRYRIGVLREPDGRGGSHYIHDRLQVGDRVGFGGPRNNFALVPSPRYSFIAGGVGITPLLPMLRMADQIGSDWRLLYLGRDRRTMAFIDELPLDSRVDVHAKAALGRADLEKWLAADDADTKLYACGPSRMLDAVEAHTRARREGWVRMERFSAREQEAPARTTAFEVELLRTGMVVTVPPETTIADSMRAAGVRVLTSCGRGVCGTCETTVVSGEPDHRDSLLSDTERAANDCIFPCVSRSLSDRLVLDL
jgi:ferredoxin-NADP reductase